MENKDQISVKELKEILLKFSDDDILTLDVWGSESSDGEVCLGNIVILEQHN